MDGTALLIRPFGGEERAFRLDIDRLRALQEKCDAGPVELIRRVEAGSWRIDDLRETLFQGLVGGGATQLAATVIIRDHFDRQPRGYAQFVSLAYEVLIAGVFGPEDEPLGEPEGAKPTRSRAAKSSSAASSGQAPSSAGRRAKSAK